MDTSEKEKIGLSCIVTSIYFLMLPLTIVTNSASDSFLKILTVPIGIYFLATVFLYRKELEINSVHICLAVYTISMFLSLLFNHSMRSLEVAFGYILNAALFLCLAVVKYNQRELKFMEDIQVLLLIFVTIVPLTGELPNNERAELVLFGQRSDPNYFTGFFIFPFAVVLKKICESKWRFAYIVLAGFALYVVLLTGSRGGLLAVMATGLAFAAIYPKGITKKLLTLGILVVSAIVFWFFVIPLLPESVAARFSVQDVIESRGTYRGDIWISMLREIKNSSMEVIFGRGLDAMHSMWLDGRLYEVGAHNQLIQVLYNQGVIGLVCFVLLVIACIARCVKKRKCVAVAIIGMMVLSMSLSFSASIKSFWNLIPYAAFAFAATEETGNKAGVIKDKDSDTETINTEECGFDER